MKTYLNIYDIESNYNELILKIQPLYCADRDSDIFNVNSKDYTPTKGDKLYFLPGVNIPRVKLKDLSLQHGIKTTRNINDATHVFAGKNTKEKMVNGGWYYSINTSAVRAILEDPELVMDDYYKENLTQALEFYTEDEIILDYSAAGQLRNSELAFVKRYTYNSVSRYSSVYYSVDSDHTDLFPDILTLDIYDESKLLQHINGDDAATIDETMFLQISDMFKSSDQDNHILAMEIMANCNYKQSLMYLEILFKENFYNLSRITAKNHVNFKSLLSYLGKSTSNMSTTIDRIILSLLEKGVVNAQKLDYIIDRYCDEIARKGNSVMLKVKTVTVDEKVLSFMNKNYEFDLLEEFETIPEPEPEPIPEVIENEEVVENTNTEEIIPKEEDFIWD